MTTKLNTDNEPMQLDAPAVAAAAARENVTVEDDTETPETPAAPTAPPKETAEESAEDKAQREMAFRIVHGLFCQDKNCKVHSAEFTTRTLTPEEKKKNDEESGKRADAAFKRAWQTTAKDYLKANMEASARGLAHKRSLKICKEFCESNGRQRDFYVAFYLGEGIPQHLDLMSTLVPGVQFLLRDTIDATPEDQNAGHVEDYRRECLALVSASFDFTAVAAWGV